MSRILTDRQADELHKSIIGYLLAHNLHSTASTLREELNLGEEAFTTETARKYQTLLEKKWTGAVRLQKKALDLESRNAALQSELDNAASSNRSRRDQDPATWLPRSPPRHSLEGHQNTINCVAFHPVFSSLATGSDDYTIKIWDWELGELERTLKGHTRAVLDVDFGGPRGAILLASCSSDSTIKLWDPADEYKNTRTLAGHEHSVSAVRFIPSSASGKNLLVSASGDKTLRLWDVASGYCIRTLAGHTAWVRDVCPSPDGRFLLSAGTDQTARLWDISETGGPNPGGGPEHSPQQVAVMAGHENGIRCCVFAPPSAYPYLAALAGMKKPPPATGAAAAATAAFAATGSRDKTVKLWNTTAAGGSAGACIATLAGHDNWVSGLAFHPGGRFLLSVSDDRTLRCWDLSQQGKCVKVLADAHSQFITCIRWAPGIVKKVGPERDAEGAGTGTVDKKGEPEMQIRCVVATASVDKVVRIFAK